MNSFLEELETASEQPEIVLGIQPTHVLSRSRDTGSGVVLNEYPSDNQDVVLLSSFYDSKLEVRLIERDGDVINRWPIEYFNIFKDNNHTHKNIKSDWNIDIHGTLVNPDGSIVFNFEYAGLVKLDKCGNLLWTVGAATHHSVEVAEGIGYWVPGRNVIRIDVLPDEKSFTDSFFDDTLMLISEQGDILDEFSISEVIYENGLAAIDTSYEKPELNKTDRIELVHMNKIEPLPADLADAFENFEAGDLALSFRYLNLILVLDPDTRKIKWHQTGPWLGQHDPEFTADGTILVFNNNRYGNRIALKQRLKEDFRPPPSNILEHHFLGDSKTVQAYVTSGEHLFQTGSRGKHEQTYNGNLVITEFSGGRVIEATRDGEVVWEYINRYDEEFVTEITEARVYPLDYFEPGALQCESSG